MLEGIKRQAVNVPVATVQGFRRIYRLGQRCFVCTGEGNGAKRVNTLNGPPDLFLISQGSNSEAGIKAFNCQPAFLQSAFDGGVAFHTMRLILPVPADGVSACLVDHPVQNIHRRPLGQYEFRAALTQAVRQAGE